MTNPQPLRFSAFVMPTASHIQHGLWRHPDARQADFEDVSLWIDLARTLEAGGFDAIFFADVVGVYGGAGASYEINAREGLQLPAHDPSVLLSALAVHTEHLGLAFTSSTLQAHPFEFARRVSTLDHISRGRIGWNIVTSHLENAARNFGHERLLDHDERYAQAQEYLDVVYKLWEGSWDDGALLKGRVPGAPAADRSGPYADHTRIHRIDHRGRWYDVEGPHLVSPSPQRTPLLFQAGASPAGAAFAARNAEASFILAPDLDRARELIANTKRLAVEAGRSADDIAFYQGITFIVGSTEEEARRKEAEIDEYLSADAFFVHSNLGTDQRTGKPIPPDTPLKDIPTQGGQGQLEWLRQLSPGREPTVADLARLSAKLRGRIVGTPESIADELEGWRDAGVAGINVMNWMIPTSYEEFADHVMPVLRRRGLAADGYTEGTLRRKLTGRDTLPETHPAARYRGAFA